MILDLLVLEMITVVGQAHEKGNEYNDYYDPNTGNSYDSNGNYQGNMNDWLWD